MLATALKIENTDNGDNFTFFVESDKTVQETGEIKEFYFIHFTSFNQGAKVLKGVLLPDSVEIRKEGQFCIMQADKVSYHVNMLFVGTDVNSISENFVNQLYQTINEKIFKPLQDCFHFPNLETNDLF